MGVRRALASPSIALSALCVLWDGALLAYPRTAEGRRVVLHFTYSRRMAWRLRQEGMVRRLASGSSDCAIANWCRTGVRRVRACARRGYLGGEATADARQPLRVHSTVAVPRPTALPAACRRNHPPVDRPTSSLRRRRHSPPSTSEVDATSALSTTSQSLCLPWC